jgi:hypothetical protein
MKFLVYKEFVNIVIINPRKYETKWDGTIKLRVKYQTQIKPASPKMKLINNLNGNFFQALYMQPKLLHLVKQEHSSSSNIYNLENEAWE